MELNVVEDSNHGTRVHEGLRSSAVAHLLNAARGGRLESGWRLRGGTTPLGTWPGWRRHGDTTPLWHLDASVLVEVELAEMPVESWEPYVAGGDWREALDSWYSAALANEERWEADLAESRSPGAPDAVERQHHFTEARDLLGASYRAGLAAGGLDVDWRGWLQERSEQWHWAEPILADDSRFDWYEKLPEYWTRSWGPADVPSLAQAASPEWIHVMARTAAWTGVLGATRAGMMPADWRGRVSPSWITVDSVDASVVADVAAAVAFELSTSPRAAWEPGVAGGDWRRALQSWYEAVLAIGEHQERWRRSRLPHVGVTPSDTPEVVAALDQYRASESFLESERRREADEARVAVMWEASFRAGLAAGGDPGGSDWRAWFEACIGEPPAAPDGALYEQLPAYWTA